jgi:FtsZ-interacting cell division protein YlmF
MRWAMDELESSAIDYARVHFYYPNSFEVAKEIAQKIKKDDVVLIKVLGG